jgi:hypothetical protein
MLFAELISLNTAEIFSSKIIFLIIILPFYPIYKDNTNRVQKKAFTYFFAVYILLMRVKPRDFAAGSFFIPKV